MNKLKVTRSLADAGDLDFYIFIITQTCNNELFLVIYIARAYSSGG